MLNTLMENENTSFVNISIPFQRSCSVMDKLFYKPIQFIEKMNTIILKCF